MSAKLFLMLLLIGLSSGAYYKSPPNSSGTDGELSSAAHKWQAADKMLRDASAMMVKNILPHALHASETLNLTSGCSRGLLQFLMGVKQTKLWAFQMLDSFGKIPNGILRGGLSALGNYDQCVDIEIPKGRSRGLYCIVEVTPPLPPRERFVPYDVIIPEFVNITPSDSVTTQVLKNARIFYSLRLRTSICVPSACTRNDVEQIAGKVVESMKLEFKVTVPNCETKVDTVVFKSTEIAVILCASLEKLEIHGRHKSFSSVGELKIHNFFILWIVLSATEFEKMRVVLSTLLLVAIVATLADVILKLRSDEKTSENISLPFKCLLCFSLNRNLHRLLKKDDSPDSIKIFHGMKAIALLWVMLCHVYLYTNYQAMSGILEERAMVADIVFQIVVNGFLSVQVFFFISAVLSAYGVMKMKQTNVNIFMFIFRRFWRLTPPFMLVIACVFLIPHLGSGPVWKETVIDQLTEKCSTNWWTNLAYVNNFVPIHEMCLRWTWYIPVDTQLYIVSLFVLIPLKRNARWGLIMNLLLFSIGITTSAVFHMYYKLHPTIAPVFDHQDDIAYASDYGYHRPYLHCGTYCIGLTVGYILATKPKIRIPLWINALGWIVALTLALSVVYGAYDWQQGHIPNSVVSTLYASSSRFLFSLVCAWITISCMNGRGGIVTSFLSWEGFVPLGRLTYMTYLVHPLVIFMYVGSTRDLIRHDHRTLVFLYLGIVMMSFMSSLPLSLLFESPFLALERLLISSKRTPAIDKDKEEDHFQIDKEKTFRWGQKEEVESNGDCIVSVTKM